MLSTHASNFPFQTSRFKLPPSHFELKMILFNDYPLIHKTTMHVGGNARFYAEVMDTDELISVLSQAKSEKLPVFILGAGSNTLIDDEGFDGYIIHPAMHQVEWQVQDNGEILVKAGAGVLFDEIVRESCERNLGGIESLSGIPGSTGGSLVQNIGAYGQEISESFVSAEAVDKNTLESVTLGREDIQFGYRHTALKTKENPLIVTSVTLRLLPFDDVLAVKRCEERGFKKLVLNPPKTALELRNLILETRKSKAMCYDENDYNTHGVGSFFVNPVVTPELAQQIHEIAVQRNLRPMSQFDAPNGVKLSAAWLIENAGFDKGYLHDGAALSEKHCLAIINRDHATSVDVIGLAKEIIDRVQTTFGVTLSPEVVYLSRKGISCI